MAKPSCFTIVSTSLNGIDMKPSTCFTSSGAVTGMSSVSGTAMDASRLSTGLIM